MKLETPLAIVGALAAFFAWITFIGYFYAFQWARRVSDDELPALRRKLFRITSWYFLGLAVAASVVAAMGESMLEGLLFFGVMLPLAFLAWIGGEQLYFYLRMRRAARRKGL